MSNTISTLPKDTQTEQKPAYLYLQVRPRKYKFEPDVLGADWNDRDICKTQVFNFASILAEVGEDFILRKAPAILKTIQDEHLIRKFKAFFGQEATHKQAHIDYNRQLHELGYATAIPRALCNGFFNSLSFIFRGRTILALMTSAEYITAIIAERAFQGDFGNTLVKSQSDVAHFWRWHMAEEIEHRSVMHEIYKAQNGSRLQLIVSTWFIAIFYSLLFAVGVGCLSSRTKRGFRRTLYSIVEFNWGPKGAVPWLFKELVEGSRHGFDASRICSTIDCTTHLAQKA